jgi:hypothetical protein
MRCNGLCVLEVLVRSDRRPTGLASWSLVDEELGDPSKMDECNLESARSTLVRTVGVYASGLAIFGLVERQDVGAGVVTGRVEHPAAGGDA